MRANMNLPQWIGSTDAARVLSVSLYHIRRLGASGLIQTRTMPGIGKRTQYRTDDVVRLADQGVESINEDQKASV